MHNVPKNIRGLSTGSADRLMRALDVRVSDLLWRVSTESDADVRAIPDTAKPHPVQGLMAVLPFGNSRSYPVPSVAEVKDLIDPLAARLGPDLVLPKMLAMHDLVLLDQSPMVRAAPDPNSIWVVSEGSGLRVRYLRLGAARLCIANEATLEDPHKWHSIPLQGRNILDIVRARIVWLGRELEKESPGSSDPAR